MFQKTMRLSTLVGVLISSLATVKVNGSCSKDVEEIYGIDDIQSSFQAMLVAYSNQCTTDGTCQFKNYEGTLVGVNKLVADSGGPENFNLVDLIDLAPDDLEVEDLNEEAVADLQQDLQQDLENEFAGVDQDKLAALFKTNSPPIKLDATIDVSSFTEHETYVDYVSECEKLDVAVTTVDIEFQAKGDKAFAGIAADITNDGVEVDIDIKMMSVPLCLSKECDDVDDLSAIVDKLLASLLLAVDLEDQDVDLGEVNIEQILPLVSFANFCLFGKTDGLGVCALTVERSSGSTTGNDRTVGLDEASDTTSDGKSKKTFGVMVAAVITLTSVLLL